MTIHLALSGFPDWSAGADLKSFAYVHLAPSLAAMGRTYAEALEGLLPSEPILVVGQPTAIDPSRAPEGKHILWVQVRVLPATIKGDAAGTIAASHWDAAKELYADRVLDLIERYAPGLRGRFSAARFSRRSISSATIPVLSVAIVFPAATISTSISCSVRRAAGRAIGRR